MAAPSDFCRCVLAESLISQIGADICLSVAKLTPMLLVAGSTSVVDVIQIDTGKIVHVFETKKDKIKALNLMACREGKLFLLADEERDNKSCWSVIAISTDAITPAKG